MWPLRGRLSALAQGSTCPSSLCPGQEAGWHSVGIALPCIGPETLTYRFQTNSQLLSAQGTARAHRRAFRNIYTRPSLHCPGEGQRTLGMTPPPLRLVLRWRPVGTSHAQADTCVVDQWPQPSQPCPQVIALPHKTYSPKHRAIQQPGLLPACSLPCPPLSDARFASAPAGGRRGCKGSL